MRAIERLYTPLISRGPHKFKDGLNLADKDERMREGGEGETPYILIIPVVFGWCLGERVCVKGSWGGHKLRRRVSMQSSVVLSETEFSRLWPHKLPGVDAFPFNYSAPPPPMLGSHKPRRCLHIAKIIDAPRCWPSFIGSALNFRQQEEVIVPVFNTLEMSTSYLPVFLCSCFA